MVMNLEDGPLPRWLLADIDMPMFPSPIVSEHGNGLMDDTTQVSFLHDEAEMLRELQMSPVSELM